MDVPNAVVVYSNAINRASYRLSAVELRILKSAIAQIPRADADPDAVYWVDAKDLVSLGSDAKAVYAQMRQAAEVLFMRYVTIRETEYTDTLHWVYRVRYSEGDGKIGLTFSPPLLPFLSELKKSFTQYKLIELAGMTSEYAIRLYDLCMQFQDTGWVDFSISDLQSAFKCGSSYSTNITMFKRKVLDVAVKQINESEHTKIVIHYELLKTNRRFTDVRFTFRKREEEEKPKPLELTERQARNFAAKLVNARENSCWDRFYGAARPKGLDLRGKGTEESIEKVAEFLRKPGMAEMAKPWLLEVGFNEKFPKRRAKKKTT